MHHGLNPVRDVLELARRIGKLEDRALKLWVCDCIRRVRSSAELVAQLHDLQRLAKASELGPAKPSVVGSLMASPGPRLTSCEQLIELAQRYFDGEDLDLIYFAHQARSLATSTGRERWPPLYELATEEKWQARQLLTRLDMIPSCADALVRLDYAEFNGKVPVGPHGRERFDRLRAEVLRGNDTPLELVIEFFAIVFDLELRIEQPRK